jgi:hypothetical protein
MNPGALSALAIRPLLRKRTAESAFPRVNLWREKVYNQGRNAGTLVDRASCIASAVRPRARPPYSIVDYRPLIHVLAHFELSFSLGEHIAFARDPYIQSW